MNYKEILLNQIMDIFEKLDWSKELEEGYVILENINFNLKQSIYQINSKEELLIDYLINDLDVMFYLKEIIEKEIKKNNFTEIKNDWKEEIDEGYLSLKNLILCLKEDESREIFGVNGTFTPIIKKLLSKFIKTKIRASIKNNFDKVYNEEII